MRKRICAFLAIMMIFSLMTGMLETSALAAEEPANIQDTYEIDGVTYFNVGSNNFAVESTRFFKDLIGTRTNLIGREYKDYLSGETRFADASLGDLWLQVGVGILKALGLQGLDYDDYSTLDMAAIKGEEHNSETSVYFTGKRYDLAIANSLKDAEDWVYNKAYGQSQSYGCFRDDTLQQPTLVTCVHEKRDYNNISFTVAAYFTNFRVFAIMPADEGSNYVTELISDSVNSQSTTASTVKNLTASAISGSQSVSNSTTATVSSSVSGSESYSYTKGVKVGAEYKFTEAFKMNGELSYTATEAFAAGWGTGNSLSTSNSSSYTVSVPLAPYTQAMMTQTDSTSVYLTRYNCPIALKYDVTLAVYRTNSSGGGVAHSSVINRDLKFTFADPIDGARGDLNTRIESCTGLNDLDAEGIPWQPVQKLVNVPGAVEMIRNHIPMAPTGATYYQTLNVVASEVSGLMPTHPLYRVKIAEPDALVISSASFDYFTDNMEVGEFSYTNYLKLVGFNRYDAPFYGFSKDNGYWVVTDMQGNPLSDDESPVRLEKDPVSTNWRYTAVRPGSCFLVYRIDEDAYFVADKPDQPIKNEDLKKTAALEVIVTEKDPTDTIVISGSYQGHPNVDPAPLEGDDKLTVTVYDETGKEIEKPYSWEAKELRGISVTKDGQVSFTKEGVFHVRAVNGKLRSDWYAISSGHTPGDAVQENVQAATCTEPGSCDLVTYCSVCGEELSREHTEEAALGHLFDGGIVTQEPTASEEGVLTCTCQRCGETETRSIPKLTPVPAILTQPENAEAYAGTSVDFSVVAENAASYQWQFKSPGGSSWYDSGMIGAQTDRIVVSATAARSGQQYRCLVSNEYGTVISEPAVLNVFSRPIIKTQPKSVDTTPGNTVKFTVSAAGSDLTYQWQFRAPGTTTWYDSGMTGAQTATISVPATLARSGQQYRCVVSNDLGSATSSAATLNVLAKPAITAQPQSVAAAYGDAAKFTVSATGGNLSYQWQYKSAGSSAWRDSGMEGAQTATLTVPATAARNGQQYRCVVSNAMGRATSSAATLSTAAVVKPQVVSQSKNVSAAAGESVRFTVQAAGGDLTYQWQFKAPGGSTWYPSGMEGAQTATLTVPATAARNGQQYRCVVTNSEGTVTSDAAKLTVK